MFRHARSIILLFFIILSSPFSPAQEGMDENEQMKIWGDYMTPGPMHEMLAKSTGEWKTTSKFWLDPATEPMLTEGSAKTEMILGNRYQQTIHNGSVMGMPSEGIFLLGYDNAIEEFTSVWIDNLGTGTSVAKGTYDESTKILTMTGTMVDPFTKKEMNIKTVMKIVDDNHHLFEMYLDYKGQEFKSMEIEFVRN